MFNRITGSNTEELIKTRLNQSITTHESLNTRVFYFAQVISNEDPDHLNRVKCRIPVIDDDYYVNKKKDEGDSALPWVIPFSNRFLDVPEVNAVVLVAVLDTKVPHFGRMYFDSFSDFTQSEYFDKLSPEEKLKSNWDLVEDIFGIKINGKPKTQGEYNGKDNVNYKTGIRGKGKNRVMMTQTSTEIIQNKGEKTESSAVLTEHINVSASDEMKLVSKKGRKQNYNPVFDDPLFTYLDKLHSALQKVVTVLNTVPAISPTGPCTPGPNASSAISEFKSLQKALKKFKKDGSSEKIEIN